MKVVIRVLRVSGTIRKCEEEIVQRAKEQVRRYAAVEERRARVVQRRAALEGAGEEEVVEEDEGMAEDVGELVDPTELMDVDDGRGKDGADSGDDDEIPDGSLQEADHG